MQQQKSQDFWNSLPAGVRVLGLDIGTHTIGVAVGTVTTGVATPLLTIRRTSIKADAAALGKIINDYDIKGLVIGWPINMDGTEGRKCQSVKDTVTELLKHLSKLNILYQDERLSTSESYEILNDLKDKKGRGALDATAATVILQAALDAQYHRT